MFKNETIDYLFTMYNDLKDIDKKFVDLEVMIHNLDKLGYNVEGYNKFIDNLGIEIYKLKNYNHDKTKDILANIK